jgi:hypothetical protein
LWRSVFESASLTNYVPGVITIWARGTVILAPILLAAACGSSGNTSSGSTPTPAVSRASDVAAVDASGSAGGGIAIFVFKYNVVMLIAVDPTSTPSAIEQLARTAVGRLVAA